MTLAARLFELFVIGVGTPLTAVCVLPLYPAFISYLASAEGRDGRPLSPAVLGVLVVGGVLACMALVGFVFTTVLETSLTRVIETVSPVAFAILGVIGIVLLADLKLFNRIPTLEPPQTRHPSLTAFGYGFFFGAIVLPCNPALIALFFTRVPILFDTWAHGMLGFLAFGLGMGAPLLAFALLSETAGRRIVTVLTRHATVINRGTGAIVLAVSLYYLFWVFAVVPTPTF
ncbi:cytochrome c biogenesis protein CcdA [Natrialbaceae archaeon A-chndr2]